MDDAEKKLWEQMYPNLDDLARTTMQYVIQGQVADAQAKMQEYWPPEHYESLPADVEEGLEALADHQWVYPWGPGKVPRHALQWEADRILQEILAPKHGVTKEVR